MKALPNLTFALFLFLCYSSYVLSISPVYFFNSTGRSETGTPLSFNVLNLNKNTIQTLESIKFIGIDDTHVFYGIVIYYKTGVLYANYWKKTGRSTYQSHLLAVDTSSGKLLLEILNFVKG